MSRERAIYIPNYQEGITQLRVPIKVKKNWDIVVNKNKTIVWERKDLSIIPIKSPYQVGDHCYLQEAFRVASWPSDIDYDDQLIAVEYKDGKIREVTRAITDKEYHAEIHWIEMMAHDSDMEYRKLGIPVEGDNYIDVPLQTKWRSPMHMPKRCARIWLEVTEVRVERVGEITIEDMLAEGTELAMRFLYENNWNARYAKKGYGFDTNCWTWIYELERIEK